MPTSTTMENDQAAAQYRLFSGPSPYSARTPWRPLTAFGVTATILALTLLGVSLLWLLTPLKALDGNKMTLALIVTPIQQVLMIALTWAAAMCYGAKASKLMALGPPAQGLRAYVVSVLVFVAGVAAMGFIIHFISPDSNKGDIASFQEMFASPWWPVALLMVGVGAPISEELLFRGFLFPAIAQTRIGLWGAAVLTSAVWAAIHFYSSFGMVQVFVIGMLLSWILVRTGSLRVTMFCHALYNSTLAILMMSGADSWM